MKQLIGTKKIVLILSITLLLQTHWHAVLWAQDSNSGLYTDCAGFPTCRIYVPTSATATQPTLFANGQPLPVDTSSVMTEEVGVAVAFAFHEYTSSDGSAPSVRNLGETGDPRFVEFQKAAAPFVDYTERATFDITKYWWAAYKTGDNQSGAEIIAEFPAIAAWQRGDFRYEVLNTIQKYVPPENKNTPSAPLYDLIDNTIATFGTIGDAPTPIDKHIIVFTNGLLDGSTQDPTQASARNNVALPNLIAHAASNGVKIHVVLLVGKGPAGELAETLRRNAQEIAVPTRGQVVWLGETPDAGGDAYAALTPIWEQIDKARFQHVIAVNPLTLADANIALDTISVLTGTNGAAPIAALWPQFQAAQVSALPLSPTQWRGTEDLALQLEVNWPDGYADLARLASVRYLIRDESGKAVVEQADSEAPLTTMTIAANALTALTNGVYQVEAILADKLMPGAALTTPVGSFVVALPALETSATVTATQEPTVTVMPTAVPTVTPTSSAWFERIVNGTSQISLWPGLWPVVAIIGLLVLIGGWRRWRDGRRQVDVIRTSDPPDAHTLPDEQTEPDIEGFPIARLVHELGDGNLLREIPLYPRDGRKNEWSIGRRYQERDCYINHPRVSNLHAVLFEKNGRYYIRHEGSSGGTYVNRVPLPARVPEELQNGDLLNFSTAVAYRFQIETEARSTHATEPETGGTATEI